jgi:hypothetical protein
MSSVGSAQRKTRRNYDPSMGTPHLPGYRTTTYLNNDPATNEPLSQSQLYNATCPVWEVDDEHFAKFHRVKSNITMVREQQQRQADFILPQDIYVPKNRHFTRLREDQQKQAPPMGGSDFRHRSCDLVQLRKYQTGPGFVNLPMMLDATDINSHTVYGRNRTDITKNS